MGLDYMMVRVDEHGHRMPGHRPVFFSVRQTDTDLGQAVKFNAETDGRWQVYAIDPVGVYDRATVPTVTRITKSLPDDHH